MIVFIACNPLEIDESKGKGLFDETVDVQDGLSSFSKLLFSRVHSETARSIKALLKNFVTPTRTPPETLRTGFLTLWMSYTTCAQASIAHKKDPLFADD